MVSRKGQAAMEYLMTYGWAILIVLAIMGILVYLVRPQQVESCTIATPLQCEANQYTINSNQQLTINLRNLGSVSISVNGTACPSDNMRPIVPVQITPGSARIVTFNCSGSSNAVSDPKAGTDVFQEVLLMQYTVSDSTIVKSLPIEIVVRYG